jgi:hypothetical protein
MDEFEQRRSASRVPDALFGWGRPVEVNEVGNIPLAAAH